jgi:orotidine-5'-phosphate decarboxylase
MPHTWFLVPGFGSQGGAASDVAPAFDANGLGAVINNSRGIIFAHARKEYAHKYTEQQWQKAVEKAAKDMIDQLAK